MRRSRPSAEHLTDEDLVSLLESDEPAPEAKQRHVMQCSACTERIREFQRTRRLLRAAGPYEVPPAHDLARDALTRLHFRQVAISNVNELVHVMRTLVSALAKLLSRDHHEGDQRG